MVGETWKKDGEESGRWEEEKSHFIHTQDSQKDDWKWGLWYATSMSIPKDALLPGKFLLLKVPWPFHKVPQTGEHPWGYGVISYSKLSFHETKQCLSLNNSGDDSSSSLLISSSCTAKQVTYYFYYGQSKSFLTLKTRPSWWLSYNNRIEHKQPSVSSMFSVSWYWTPAMPMSAHPREHTEKGRLVTHHK